MAETVASSATADSAFRHQELYDALAKLPPKERSAIVLFIEQNSRLITISALSLLISSCIICITNIMTDITRLKTSLT